MTLCPRCSNLVAAEERWISRGWASVHFGKPDDIKKAGCCDEQCKECQDRNRGSLPEAHGVIPYIRQASRSITDLSLRLSGIEPVAIC